MAITRQEKTIMSDGTGARAEVVVLLADTDGLARISRTGRPLPAREWRHLDGRLVTDAEAGLIDSATAEDMRAVIRLIDAQTELRQAQQRDRERFAALVVPRFGELPPGSVLDDVLAILPPGERAEAEELAATLFPDGYLYPRGGGPEL
jgi:hypothetical protein